MILQTRFDSFVNPKNYLNHPLVVFNIALICVIMLGTFLDSTMRIVILITVFGIALFVVFVCKIGQKPKSNSIIGFYDKHANKFSIQITFILFNLIYFIFYDGLIHD